MRSIQVKLGLPKLCPIVGTANRWFHKMSEIERLLEMKVTIGVFQERVTTEVTDEDDDPIDDIEDSDWVLMQEYVNAVKPFQIISRSGPSTSSPGPSTSSQGPSTSSE